MSSKKQRCFRYLNLCLRSDRVEEFRNSMGIRCIRHAQAAVEEDDVITPVFRLELL